VLNFTTDDMKKSNDDLDNAVSTLNFTTDDMKKNNNGNSNNTDAASTNNYEKPSDYNTETDDSVVADSNHVMKDIKDVSYNNSTAMENSEEETKQSGNATSTLDETILPIDTVDKCDANDNDDNIATRATKYVCFNTSTTADIEQLLSSLRHSDGMLTMVEYNGVSATVEIILASNCSPALDDCSPPLHLHPHDIFHIAALQLTTGEGLLIVEFANLTDQMLFLIY